MDNAQSVIDLAISSTELKYIDGTPIAIVPTGYKTVEMSTWLELPTRKKGVITLDALNSFIEYVKKHKTPETAIYFADSDPRRDVGRSFTAVLDDHGLAPGWREFKAVHTLEFSRQLIAWGNKAERGQKAFAEFLEDRISDVLAPDGAKLFEIVTTLEATQNATYGNQVNLGNGDVRFSYTRETKAGSGALELPQKITLKIPIWDRSEPEQIDVKLRFRLAEDHPYFRMEIERRDELMDAAVDDAVETVRIATNVPVYFGFI